MNATRQTRHETPDPSGIAVSNHVRELLAKAERVDDEQYPNCRAYRYGSVTIVVDDTDDVVKTVVQEAGR